MLQVELKTQDPFISLGAFIYDRDRMISIGMNKICLLYFIITLKKSMVLVVSN